MRSIMRRRERKYEWVDPVADRIARYFIRMQLRVTSALNKGVACWSKKTLTVSLVCFCVLAGGSSLLITGRSLFTTTAHKKIIRFDKMNLPRTQETIGPTEEEQKKWEEEIAQKVKLYQQVMDSLGEPVSEGLRDSLQMIEKILK